MTKPSFPQLRPWSAALIIGLIAISMRLYVDNFVEGVSSNLSYTFLISLTVSVTLVLVIGERIPFVRRYMDMISEPPQEVPSDTSKQRFALALMGLPVVAYCLWKAFSA